MELISENATVVEGSLPDTETAQLFFERTKPFSLLMTQYKCAMLEVRTKLDVLNAEMSLESERNPFESISCRLKSPLSIMEKLSRKGLPMNAKSIEENLFDVAGIRVICSHPSDIYMLADKLCNQDDIRLVCKKDYIKNPKPNGYRSLHLIVEIPIFLSNEKKYMAVEVQFRTIAMDFWASLEHKIRYKKELSEESLKIAEELKLCADDISALDARMQSIRDRIEQMCTENSENNS